MLGLASIAKNVMFSPSPTGFPFLLAITAQAFSPHVSSARSNTGCFFVAGPRPFWPFLSAETVRDARSTIPVTTFVFALRLFDPVRLISMYLSRAAISATASSRNWVSFSLTTACRSTFALAAFVFATSIFVLTPAAKPPPTADATISAGEKSSCIPAAIDTDWTVVSPLAPAVTPPITFETNWLPPADLVKLLVNTPVPPPTAPPNEPVKAPMEAISFAS